MSDDITSMTETERKYDVPEDAEPPEVAGFTLRRPERPDLLDAVYFDTEDGALAARRIVLRRRTGGHDEGWHVKTPAEEGRTEYHAPLSETVPPALLELVQEHLGGGELTPIAEIRTERWPIIVLDEDGREVAELADDRVAGTDIRSGTVRTWREWEVELIDGAPTDPAERRALLDRLEAVVLAEGAVPAAAVSKFARATGRLTLGAEGQ
ncbi:CYTH domain-containing protein [Naasia sp. SYSU D00057]|uniref:CYTH domain-containing protein n=1 Tax=Naasia sp. SYSU D00057 TaxID=2817380 RepID=UPI001B312D8D|nr:CYTH domain-containing protein [Naasia sp. SYSU D00057]